MSLRDVQNEEDVRGKHIAKVGVRNIEVPVSIRQGNDNVPTKTVGNISIYTSLSENIRGTNMSRFSEILHEAIQEDIHHDLIYVLLKKIKEKLESDDSYIKLVFPYFLMKTAPVSKIDSYMSYRCILEGEASSAGTRSFLTVEVPYTSLCPCSKAISEYGAHNQRSLAKVTVELKEGTFVDIKDIIKLVEDTVSCPIYTTLKRTDEKYVTEKAYENAKFVEDVVRDLATRFDEWLDEQIVDYAIVVEHYESIHKHDAVAIITAGRNLC